MEKSDCIFDGEQYPDGCELRIGDRCIKCNDGEWGPGEFEAGYWC
jgi:hypothetical protein